MSLRNDTRYKYREMIYRTYFTQKVKPHGSALKSKDYEAWAAAAMVRLEGWLPHAYDAPILDLGCGSGQFLYMLERLGYTKLVGIDLSQEQVELARQWCSDAMIIQGDIISILEVQTSQFELITAFDVIEHFSKPEAIDLVAQIEKVLRPGGRIIVQTPNAASPLSGATLYGDLTHEWFYTPVSLGDILRLQGFTDYLVRPSSPYPHSKKSAVRTILWKLLNAFWKLCNLIETGSQGSGIFTRVFVASAVKPQPNQS